MLTCMLTKDLFDDENGLRMIFGIEKLNKGNFVEFLRIFLNIRRFNSSKTNF